MLMRYGGVSPRLPASVYIADGAVVIGDVEIGEDSSIWFNTVVRGDVASIRIGRGSNIQDNCTVHVTSRDPVVIGDDVTIGHGVTVHGCTIEDLCLIGIGSIVLDGAVIGRGSVIGAGAVVPPKSVVPPGSLVLGVPGKVTKSLGEGAADANRATAAHYVAYARSYREMPG